MKLKSSPPVPLAPTDPLPSSRRPSQPPWCVVTELRDLVAGTYHAIPVKAEVTIGRDKDNDIVLDYTAVSRVHARCYPRLDHIDVHDRGSMNKSFLGATEVQDFRLVPGTVARFGSVDVLAQSAIMGVHARALDRLVGRVPVVNAILRAARTARCLVFAGPRGACLDRVVAAAHGVATEGRAPLITCAAAHLADADGAAGVGALLADVADGWLALDLRAATRPPGRALPHRLLERLLAPAQGATLAVVLEAEAPTVLPPVELAAYQPRVLAIPSIRTRIRDGGLPTLVDQIFAADGSTLTFAALHTDVAAAIAAAPWPRNYEQLADVLVYAGRRRRGHPNAASGLITSASNALFWIDKLRLPRILWGIVDT